MAIRQTRKSAVEMCVKLVGLLNIDEAHAVDRACFRRRLDLLNRRAMASRLAWVRRTEELPELPEELEDGAELGRLLDVTV